MKKKKLKAELSKTKKKLADAKVKLKAVKSTPMATVERKTTAAKTIPKAKPVTAKPAKSAITPKTKAKRAIGS